jgi:hypothetical protein
MKKFVIPALSLLLFLPAGCDWHRIRGNGHILSEERPVSPFTDVDAGGGYEMEWHPGPASLRLTTDENLLPRIETSMKGTLLRIKTNGPLAPTHGLKIAITSPSLTGASLSGAARFNATQLSGPNFTLETSGASRITLAGRTTRLTASLTGASRLSAEALKAEDVELSVTGAGKAHVAAANSLKASITGAGKVTYSGNPRVLKKEITGAGSIERQQ